MGKREQSLSLAAAKLSVRTERLARRIHTAAVRSARRQGVRDADRAIVGLHAKVTANTRAARLLCGAGMPCEGFGLHRAGIEAVVHLIGLTEHAHEGVARLEERLTTEHGGRVPDDAASLLRKWKDDPSGLLAIMYIHWAGRQTQKAVNDSARSGNKHLQGVLDAPAVVDEIARAGEAALGSTLWSIVSEERHWHPHGHGHRGNSTKIVFQRLGLELAYLVPFRFASKSLHAGDYDDYVDAQLNKLSEKWEPGLVASAQQLLCKSSEIVCTRYVLSTLLAEVLAINQEGDRLRDAMI